jgi:cell division protein FtsQ
MDARTGNQAHSPFHYSIQVFKLLLFGAIIFFSVFTINQFRLSKYFPIKTVKIYGINHVDQKDVQELLAPLLVHGFFSINVEYIRDRLLQQPWVSDISVRRNWPDQVEVTVVEKMPVARWDKATLLSDAGVLFTPKEGTYSENLPVFDGPEGKQILMLNYFNEINRLLTPLHAKISYLELTPYLSWRLKLDSGITLQIGHKDILTRLDHFVKVYPKIIGNHAGDVESVDLRYPNGVAVRWKMPVNT